ncbi:MAG: non-hydrolyzing UDP-N-acetylglucosamine 2-epimerase [Gammaproteobacteria bacterium]
MKILSILGTRPEAIKLAPVIKELRARPATTALLCTTGQHKELLDPMLELFDLRPDAKLQLMRPDQSLNQLFGRMIAAIDEQLQHIEPDTVIVQGDTTTAFAATLAAFHRQINVAYVEAGLRTHNLASPFPEEMNRQAISRIANLHFAPTTANRANLLAEGIEDSRIFVTGNPVIDALKLIQAQIPAHQNEIASELMPYQWQPSTKRRMILVTGHRRENFGQALEHTCSALKHLIQVHPDLEIVFPVHLNPKTQATVQAMLADTERIWLIPPVGYRAFVWLMQQAWLIISDSGGVQEEAASLGTPVLVTRQNTERLEAIEAGTALVAGTTGTELVAMVNRLLKYPDQYRTMAQAKNPYGDGRAAIAIADILEQQAL